MALTTGISVAPTSVVGAHRGGARRANRRDDGGLEVRARIDRDFLARLKAFNAGDFDIAGLFGRRSGKSSGSLRKKSAQLLSVSAPSGKRPALP